MKLVGRRKAEDHHGSMEKSCGKLQSVTSRRTKSVHELYFIKQSDSSSRLVWNLKFARC